MITNKEIKHIKSLRQKKNRIKNNMFIAEGDKTISELIKHNFNILRIYSTNNNLIHDGITIISKLELSKISNLSNPKDSVAIFEIPTINKIDSSKLIISLDGINDPGNLGTIIRLCDWFGIKDIVCSKDTVDCYNPKVVQSSMGSISRVNITYLELNNFLHQINVPVYGTFTQGDSIFSKNSIKEGVLLFGNEANGISDKLLKFIDVKISIPRFGELKKTESLNVANATAIILAENSRKIIER